MIEQARAGERCCFYNGAEGYGFLPRYAPGKRSADGALSCPDPRHQGRPPLSMPCARSSTAERILLAAGELFYVEGVRAATIDGIAARAGVTKRTVYYHYRSKDDLIATWLSRQDEITRAMYEGWLGNDGRPMESSIATLFRRQASFAQDPRWKGCGFARAATELAGMPGHPGVAAAKLHKLGLEAWLAERLRQDGLSDAPKLARRIMLLLDGAITQVLVHHDVTYMVEAGEAAAELVAIARSRDCGDAGHTEGVRPPAAAPGCFAVPPGAMGGCR